MKFFLQPVIIVDMPLPHLNHYIDKTPNTRSYKENFFFSLL